MAMKRRSFVDSLGLTITAWSFPSRQMTELKQPDQMIYKESPPTLCLALGGVLVQLAGPSAGALTADRELSRTRAPLLRPSGASLYQSIRARKEEMQLNMKNKSIKCFYIWVFYNKRELLYCCHWEKSKTQ